jgi:hypothetical protein
MAASAGFRRCSINSYGLNDTVRVQEISVVTAGTPATRPVLAGRHDTFLPVLQFLEPRAIHGIFVLERVVPWLVFVDTWSA